MVRLCAVLWSRQASQIRWLLVGSHGTYSFVVTVRAVPVAGMVCSRVYCCDLVLRSRLLVVGVARLLYVAYCSVPLSLWTTQAVPSVVVAPVQRIVAPSAFVGLPRCFFVVLGLRHLVENALRGSQ